MPKKRHPPSKNRIPPIRKSDTIIKIIIKQTYIQAYMQLACTRTRKKEIRRKGIRTERIELLPPQAVPLPDHYRVVNRRLRHSAPLTRVRGTSLEKTLINRFSFTHPGGEGLFFLHSPRRRRLKKEGSRKSLLGKILSFGFN